MKRIYSIFLTTVIAAAMAWLSVGPVHAQVPIYTKAPLFNTANVAITGGNVWFTLGQTAIPLVMAPTGTMANNGAMTLGTAQDTTYAQGYFLVPAGAIAAGVPAAADWYYGTMSSTTAVTLFNNTLSVNVDANGFPTIPASPTAFSTTGPGAFTGVTTITTALTLTLGAGVMGPNGGYMLEIEEAIAATAGNRTLTVSFGGTQIHNSLFANGLAGRMSAWVRNRNSASSQTSFSQLVASTNAFTGVSRAYPAVNTANAVSVQIQMTRATATDVFAIENVIHSAKNAS